MIELGGKRVRLDAMRASEGGRDVGSGDDKLQIIE